MNKKFLKGLTLAIPVLLGCITACSAFATSCGCSSEDVLPSNVLPESVYKFSEDGKTLLGFQDAFLNDPDSDIYKDNFKNCNTMEIPARVTSISYTAFVIQNPTTQEYETTIPPFITNLTFTESSNCSTVGAVAFYSCSALTSIILPSALKIIDSGAFQNCRSLHSIDFSNCTNLSAIYDGAFYGCSKLTSIDLSNATNLTTIGGNEFGSCSELTSVTFPSSLQSIGANAFQECSKLNDIKWNSWTGNIDNLDQTSFSGVSQTRGTVSVKNQIEDYTSIKLLGYLLTNGGLPETWKVALPIDVYDIDENNVLLGFKEGIDLTQYKDACNTMEIPARVTSISDDAFYSNSKSTIPSFIKNLTFAENSNCSTVGMRAFINCSALTFVNLLNCSKLTTIGDHAFEYCQNLTSVTFPSSLIQIDNFAFESCSKLTSVDLLNTNISAIQTNAFKDCSELTSISLPSSLKLIQPFVFENCQKLNYIAWDLLDDYETKIEIQIYAFSEISSTGRVKSLNPSITSQQLLEWIKTKGDFPSGDGWKVAD